MTDLAFRSMLRWHQLGPLLKVHYLSSLLRTFYEILIRYENFKFLGDRLLGFSWLVFLVNLDGKLFGYCTVYTTHFPIHAFSTLIQTQKSYSPVIILPTYFLPLIVHPTKQSVSVHLQWTLTLYVAWKKYPSNFLSFVKQSKTGLERQYQYTFSNHESVSLPQPEVFRRCSWWKGSSEPCTELSLGEKLQTVICSSS